MIDLALSPEDEQKRNQMMQQRQAPLATPQAPQQQKGMAGQMGDMVKQKLMSDAAGAGAKAITGGLEAAGTSALGSGAMTGMATAIPYVGAGLMAGKMLGLFSQGGPVSGFKDLSNKEMEKLSPKELEEYLKALERNAMGYNTGGQVGPLSAQYNAQGTMSKEQAMALMNNQPEPIQTMPPTSIPMPMARPNPDELYNEIMAESMTEAAQQAMPMMRPPLRIDPLNADTTYSPYDMIRPDNAPNT